MLRMTSRHSMSVKHTCKVSSIWCLVNPCGIAELGGCAAWGIWTLAMMTDLTDKVPNRDRVAR
jgi:hypothetical protein